MSSCTLKNERNAAVAFLGAAHGIAGILQALLSFPDFLACNPDSRDLVRRSVDFLLNLCREEANIATNLNGALDGSGKLLVHWCHGAAGNIQSRISS